MPDNSAVQRNGRMDTFDHELVECPLHRREGFGAGRGVHDQLSEQRIVVWRHDVADLNVGIPPDARAPRNSAGQ